MRFRALHGDGDSPLAPDEDHELAASCEGGVEQVALKQCIMLGVQDHYDAGILAALALVHRDRVGGRQLVQFVIVVDDFPLVEANRQLTISLVQTQNAADVAVENLLS